MCACELSISSDAPYTPAMRTRIDIASCGAGPCPPSSIAWSRSLNVMSESRIPNPESLHYNPRMPKQLAAVVLLGLLPFAGHAQGQRARDDGSAYVTVLKPARVWDGDVMHEGWAVRVKGERIDAVGAAASIDATGAKVIDLP